MTKQISKLKKKEKIRKIKYKGKPTKSNINTIRF